MKKTLLSVSIAALVSGCASGGGGVITAPVVRTPVAPPAAPTVTDNRYEFDPFSTTTQVASGDAVVTYKVGEFKSSDAFTKTEKYKIEDFGFLEVSVKGLHGGCPVSECGPEAADPGPWSPGAHQIIESDINNDGHMDFYVFESFIGTRDKGPYESIQAFINDGNGHFILSTDKVFADGQACSNQGTWVFDDRAIDPNCGNNIGSPRHILVADFNNDGMDDIFGGMVLQLSEDGKLHNKTLTNLPEYFTQEHMAPLFKHDQYAGDATGDGNLDIFMPLIQHAVAGKWADGTDIDGCSQCIASTPWALLVNDGTGNFSLNQNFPMFGVGMQHPLLRDYLNIDNPSKGILWGGGTETMWATTAAIGDFDKDGHGDVAVGWYNPYMTETWGLGKNSAGAVYYNDGNNDWRNRDIVPLPENWYGANGNANDMEVMDFNGDGWIDIVLASTKHEPYYEGRVIQFFANNQDGTFTDVTTSVHPDPTKYENGTGTPLWNGEGQLRLVDFNHDGNMDIVDSVNNTYVLVNDGNGKFSMVDHTNFPTADDIATLFPVEIDGKYQYDFISYTKPACIGDTCTTSYYQVLDPPTIYELMINDLFSKPASYGSLASMSNTAFNDLFYYGRNNSFEATGFTSYRNGVVEGGVIFQPGALGVGFMSSEGLSTVGNTVSSNKTNSLAVFANAGKFKGSVAYSYTDLNATVDTQYFGLSKVDTTAKTVGVEVTYGGNFSGVDYRVGPRFTSTTVNGFTETNTEVPLTVADQTYNVGTWVSNVAYTKRFYSNNAMWYMGGDVEYLYNFYSSSHDVRFSTGGDFITSTVPGSINKHLIRTSFNAGVLLDNKFNIGVSAANVTDKEPMYTLFFSTSF